MRVLFKQFVEMFIKSECRVSELRLVKNSKGSSVRYGFLDLLVIGFNKPCFKSNIIFELKYLTLKGLYCGEINKLVEDCSYNLLKHLDDRISNETDETILTRNYIFWSNDDKKYKSMFVRDIIYSGVEQLKNYISLIKKGEICKSTKLGILDDRINLDVGNSIIGGWLLISLGSKRIIARKIDFNSIELHYKYKKVNLI